MPNIAYAPGIPNADQKNVVVPSGICAFWRSRCPNGSLDDVISLGSIKSVEFTPNETTADIKTTYRGVQTTFKRVITDVSGTLTFAVQEMVGTNLLLIFRPVTTVNRTVSGGNGKTLYGTVGLNLSGTTPVTIAGSVLEYDADAGTELYPDLTVVRVESSSMVDAATGRGIQYVEGVDYTFVQASGDSGTALDYSSGSGTFAVGETITGPIGFQYRDGTSPGAAVLSPTANDIALFAIEIAYTNATGAGAGTVPEVGEVITDGVETGTIVKVMPGSTAFNGTVYVNWDSDFSDGAGTVPLTGNRGFIVPAGGSTVVKEVANKITLGTLAGAGPITNGYAVPASNTLQEGSVFAAVANAVAAMSSSDGLAGTPFAIVNAGGTRAAPGTIVLQGDVVVHNLNAAPTATVTVSSPTTATQGTVAVTGATGEFIPGGVITGGTSSATGVVTGSTDVGNSAGATIARIAGGSIPDGAEVVVTFSYKRDAYAYSILDGVIITGELQLQVLSTNGPQSVYTFFNVNLALNGAITFNPEEELAPSVIATILPNSAGQRGEFCILSGFSDFALTSC